MPSAAPTTPRLWRGWSQSGGVRVAELQGGGCEGKSSVQLFVVEDCLRSYDRTRRPLQVASSKSDVVVVVVKCDRRCLTLILGDASAPDVRLILSGAGASDIRFVLSGT